MTIDRFIEKLEDPIYLFFIGLMILCFIIPLFIDDKKKVKNTKKVFTNWELSVPNTVLVNEIIRFTGPILHEKGIKYFPTFTIRYYKHKAYLGLFHNSDSSITIYLKGHQDIPAIVDTVLHEVAHLIQQKTDLKSYKKYKQYSADVGYYNNPFEIESRAFAKRHTKDCLQYLVSKNMIKKH